MKTGIVGFIVGVAVALYLGNEFLVVKNLNARLSGVENYLNQQAVQAQKQIKPKGELNGRE